MNERTIMSVVADIRVAYRKSVVQPVELDVLVDELVLLVAERQCAIDQIEARRDAWRERQRRHRMSRDVTESPPTPPRDINKNKIKRKMSG